MKKKCVSGLGVLLVLGLVACGKVDEEVQIVIDKIDSIGAVDYDDEVLIGEIEDAYLALQEEQKKQVSNFHVLSVAREELDALILAKPIPFSTANWKTTQSELIELMEKAPDDEYDNDFYGHMLVYSDTEYEGYIGEAKFGFENGTLTRVFFVFDGYDESIYNYFYDLYLTKYGEPEFKNEVGVRWDNENALIGITESQLFGGSLNCTFISPDVLEE